MSEDEADGEVTPRASHQASSPERTPGRSPEGHVASLVQEAEERSQRRAAAIRHVLESIRITEPPPLPQRLTADVRIEATAESEGIRSSHDSTTLEELLPREAPRAVLDTSNEPNLEAWRKRCESLEKALERCRLEVQQTWEASQAELAAVEGRVAKREAELRQEIIDLRSQHAKEREKWRAEGKRLQSSLKETQRRAKAESEAKVAATEQVEVLRQQLGRHDAKRSKEDKEAKALDEMRQRHREFSRWIISCCAEALGEEVPEVLEDSMDRIRDLLSKLIQRGQRADHGRAEVKTERSCDLQTEWRSRVRVAEQAQKKMQKLIQEEAEAQAAHREMHTEEVVELKLQVNALQRAKEVSERFVEEEEDSWLRSKAQLREAEAEVSSAVSRARQFEAEARCASEDAIRAQATATGALAAQRRLQAELESLEKVPKPGHVAPDLGQAQQRWRDTAVLEEVSEAQRQMGHWRNEAERSGAEVTKLRVKLEELQRQSLEQAKVEEANRNLMQQALKEQGQEMQLEFDRALREVQDLRDKQEYELEDKIRQLEENDLAVETLKKDMEDRKMQQVDTEGQLEQLQDELSKSAELLHNSEVVAQEWQNEAQEHKEKLNEEVLALHQSYAKRLQSLRAQHGGERRAFEAAEEELRQIYTKELQISRRHQEAWSEATEAALAGEAAEARLARKVQEESESAVMRQEMEVQQKLQAQLLLLKSHLGGPEAPAGLHPTSYELFKDLCWSIEAALCEEVRQNPCSELRRSLCRDLKQELRDQLRSEIQSAQRSREASTGSTTGSSARRFQAQESPPSAIRQELSRRGAALMEAFAAAAETKG